MGIREVLGYTENVGGREGNLTPSTLFNSFLTCTATILCTWHLNIHYTNMFLSGDFAPQIRSGNIWRQISLPEWADKGLPLTTWVEFRDIIKYATMHNTDLCNSLPFPKCWCYAMVEKLCIACIYFYVWTLFNYSN